MSENERREITTENLSTPPIRIKAAPLLRRLGAGLIDSSIVGTFSIAMIAIAHISVFSMLVSYRALSILAFVTFIYYFLQEAIFSTTVGKSLVGLKVVDSRGDDCSFSASFKRNALRFLDWLPLLYIVGVIAIITSGGSQRIGDRIADTLVTSKPEKDPNPPPAPFLFH
jgi:uncharacterized RDD family membrane protein YckC